METHDFNKLNQTLKVSQSIMKELGYIPKDWRDDHAWITDDDMDDDLVTIRKMITDDDLSKIENDLTDVKTSLSLPLWAL